MSGEAIEREIHERWRSALVFDPQFREAVLAGTAHVVLGPDAFDLYEEHVGPAVRFTSMDHAQPNMFAVWDGVPRANVLCFRDAALGPDEIHLRC